MDKDRSAPELRRSPNYRGLFGVGLLVVVLLAAGALFSSGFGCAGTPVAKSLNALPFPGTPDASPKAQIAFPALSASDVKTVTVQGSKSGRHTGQLSALPGGRGVAFVPDAPFTPGESVTVEAKLTSAAAGTAIGAPGANQVAYKFSVATFWTGTPAPISQGSTTTDPPKPPLQSFHSRPDLQPPVVTVSTANLASSSDHLFIDAQMAPQNGPMILDTKGNLVWFQPVTGGAMAFNVRVQTYQGAPVLTWWQGQLSLPGYGRGQGVIVDQTYKTVATVSAAEGFQADLHDFLLTSRGTALITVYQPVQADLSSIGGPKDGTLLDCIVQEIDVKTGRLLWEWHALGHIPLTSSYAGKPAAGTPYDYFHINSIVETPDGNLIISARNTWAIYEINRSTGAIIWQLGGKGSTFTMGPGTQFEWQHDAGLQPDGTVTLFNNASSPQEETQSRAMQLKLDTIAKTCTLVTSYTHTPPLLSGSQGNMQILPSGDVFVGWGDKGVFTEFTSAGAVVFNASLPAPAQTYRAFRNAWTGQPAAPPVFATEKGSDNSVTVYASWNGATEVATWQLLGGSDPGSLSPLASTTATGFETAIESATSAPYLAVRALDSSGKVLGTSASAAS